MKRRTSKSKGRKPESQKTFGGITGKGWVKQNHSAVIYQIQARNPIAWCLLSQIADRAWRGPGINQYGCRAGEAFIGDYLEHNWTRMQYRVAQKVLEKFEQATFRTTNRGTIAKLISKEVYDINADLSVTDRVVQPSDSQQAAIRQPSDSHQTANRQPSDSHQTATNKNVRREEARIEEQKENKTTNNGADAHPDGGGNLHPAGVPGADAPEGMPDMTGDEKPMSPAQKAVELSKFLPRYVKTVTKCNQLPVFTQATLSDAIEYFERNTDYEAWEVGGICALGIKLARENPAPQHGVDPLFYSRRFAHKPNRLFSVTKEGDLFLAVMQIETKYDRDYYGSQELHDFFAEEIQRVKAQ